ncbi:hypothetical protein EV44_g5541 [Erysiphe necator]|uniref:Uncharacterized protein n=1 Tax=Uncinula necator TaxID=52586 RepID=A0A0B1NY83_UNCNE|nr:hypothetical protein EV44_g5541 [Erysiphe necator]
MTFILSAAGKNSRDDDVLTVDDVFSPKGKAPLRPGEEDLCDKQELEWEKLPESSFDRPKMIRAVSEPRVMLDWSFFDWKPDPKSFLRGISYYFIYRETILLQLECIGYHSELKLTQLDELKLAAVIQRTVTIEIAEMIAGMKSGLSMIRLFENTFRRAGSIQIEALGAKLSGLRRRVRIAAVLAILLRDTSTGFNPDSPRRAFIGVVRETGRIALAAVVQALFSALRCVPTLLLTILVFLVLVFHSYQVFTAKCATGMTHDSTACPMSSVGAPLVVLPR